MVKYDALLPRSREPGYGLGNLRAAFEANGLELAFWVRNVSDTRYRSYIQKFGPVQLIAFPGEPRTFGVSLTYRFGQ